MRHLLLAAALLLPVACVSDDSLFEQAPRNRPVKIVVLDVEGSRASLTVTETALADIRRLPGVLEAVRGAGLREVRCLVEERIEPQSLVSALNPRYRVIVLETIRREVLPEE